MSFRKKIDMILEAKQLERLSINKIEKLLGVDGTIYKAHKADKYPVDPNLVSDLVRKLGIRKEWWEKDWKSGSSNIFDPNITPVQNEPAIEEKPLTIDPEAYRRLIEGETEYFIIPKTAFEGKYRLMPIEEIALKEKELERRNDELIRKDHQIEQLYELFKMIASGAPGQLPSIQKAQKEMGL